MSVITRCRDDDGLAVYTVEWAFFYRIGRAVHVTHKLWIDHGSLLDRWLGARAR